MTVSNLSRQITDFVVARTEAILSRYLPDLGNDGAALPGFFCGYKLAGYEGPNLVFLLAHLHSLGVKQIAGQPIEKLISKILRGIHGPSTQTFYSFFTADAVLAFGKFEGNPLLAGFTAEERENIKAAADTTRIYDPETKSLGKWANNYWAVLARCEYTRKELGILPDDSLLKQAAGELEKLLFRNPLGFFDDVREGFGRYDIYSGDVHLFCEPLWPLFDQKKLEHNLRVHTALMEKLVMENGASFAWGRSVGPMSVCLSMEFLAMALERGFTSDPARALGLVRHAFEEFTRCFQDDLIAVHREANTEAYRGIFRIMQTSFDCLAKLCYAAEKLQHVSINEEKSSLLFPDRDEFIPFDDRNAGVWIFRNQQFGFQLALTGGESSDYVAWPRSPGLFENPVDSRMFCGVPRIAHGNLEFTTMGLPSSVEKTPQGLTVTHDVFRCVTIGQGTEKFAGRCVARYQVQGDTLVIDETLTFDEAPQAVSYFIPETAKPLDVTFQSRNPFHSDTVAVEGMIEWRSAWGGIRNLHQAHFQPAHEIHFTCTIRPKLRTYFLPARQADYVRAIIDELSPRDVTMPEVNSERVIAANLPELERELDIMHFHWPEHLLANPGFDEAGFDQYKIDFAKALGRCKASVVWTMHNRRPHWWSSERGKRLYDAWAQIADGVIHHSEWGRKLALEIFPFRPDAVHAVIPHGHFGQMMTHPSSRAELEARFGLPPCEVRFGLLGRWQPEKQPEMIIAAFAKGAKPGQQLVVTSYNEKTPRPDDPRIIFLPRQGVGLAPRSDIAAHTLICDALVSAHSGDTYLTSGVSADAIGLGIPMLVPHWEYFEEVFGDAAFYHDNTGDSIAALFGRITRADIEAKKQDVRALQPANEWSLVAEKTVELYRSLPRKRRYPIAAQRLPPPDNAHRKQRNCSDRRGTGSKAGACAGRNRSTNNPAHRGTSRDPAMPHAPPPGPAGGTAAPRSPAPQESRSASVHPAGLGETRHAAPHPVASGRWPRRSARPSCPP